MASRFHPLIVMMAIVRLTSSTSVKRWRALLMDVVGGVALADACDGFGPGEGGPLAIGIKGSFAPRVEAVKTLLGFAFSARNLTSCSNAGFRRGDLRTYPSRESIAGMRQGRLL